MRTIQIPTERKGHLAYYQDKAEIDQAIQRVLDHGHYVMGPEVPAFEAEFAAYCDAAYSVAVTSGTTSLHIALLALELGPDDEVLTVAGGDLAPSLAVLHTGAQLTWVDICEETLNMDPASLRDTLSAKTRAVIAVDMYGAPADMDALRDALDGRDDITLIEDFSLAVGATYRGKKAGSLADIGCTSLAAGKVLGVLGSGGALTTHHEHLYRRINEVRHYGRAESPYWHDDPLPPVKEPDGMVIKGLNERMDSIQAAVARVKLRHLERDLGIRRAIAAVYDEYLKAAPCRAQRVLDQAVSSYRSYVILVEPQIRDQFVQKMAEAGIRVGLQYIPPDHLHPYFLERGCQPGMLPVIEKVADALACLPIEPTMSVEDVHYVAETARKLLFDLSG